MPATVHHLPSPILTTCASCFDLLSVLAYKDNEIDTHRTAWNHMMSVTGTDSISELAEWVQAQVDHEKEIGRMVEMELGSEYGITEDDTDDTVDDPEAEPAVAVELEERETGH